MDTRGCIKFLAFAFVLVFFLLACGMFGSKPSDSIANGILGVANEYADMQGRPDLKGSIVYAPMTSTKFDNVSLVLDDDSETINLSIYDPQFGMMILPIYGCGNITSARCTTKHIKPDRWDGGIKGNLWGEEICFTIDPTTNRAKRDRCELMDDWNYIVGK